MLLFLQQTPDTVIDPSFCGLVTESDRRCILHRQRAGKFVAFEGTDTGRRFIGCATEVMDQVSVDLMKEICPRGNNKVIIYFLIS